MSPMPRAARAPHSSKILDACPHCGSHVFTRRGTRKKKLEIVQLWRCASCKRTSTPGPEAIRNKTYPLRTVIDALSSYSLGYLLQGTAVRVKSTKRPLALNSDVIPISSLAAANQQRQRLRDFLRAAGLQEDGRTTHRRHVLRRVRRVEEKAYTFLLQRSRHHSVILRAGTPVDHRCRKIKLPHTLQGVRGVARNLNFRTRGLQRSLKIQRNKRLLLDHEDSLSCEIGAIHGCGSLSAPLPYAPAQGFIMAIPVIGCLQRDHERQVVHLSAPPHLQLMIRRGWPHFFGTTVCNACCIASRAPYF
jgi:hypothetical protein